MNCFGECCLKDTPTTADGGSTREDPDVRGIATIEEAAECDDGSVEVKEIIAYRTRGQKRVQMLETGEI